MTNTDKPHGQARVGFNSSTPGHANGYSPSQEECLPQGEAQPSFLADANPLTWVLPSQRVTGICSWYAGGRL